MKQILRMAVSAAILAGTLSPYTVKAQEREVMSLHDCMEYAVSNSTAMMLQEDDRNDEQWQRNFVEQVGISPVEFIVPFALISVLTLAIVALMSWRAVRSNPVETLRKE